MCIKNAHLCNFYLIAKKCRLFLGIWYKNSTFVNQMAIQLALTEGESLLILQRRSGKSVDEVAKMLDINPSHLSKIFRSENLTSKIKSKASSVFSLPDSFFESKSIASDKALDYVQETGVKYTRRSASSKGMFLTIVLLIWVAFGCVCLTLLPLHH